MSARTKRGRSIASSPKLFLPTVSRTFNNYAILTVEATDCLVISAPLLCHVAAFTELAPSDRACEKGGPHKNLSATKQTYKSEPQPHPHSHFFFLAPFLSRRVWLQLFYWAASRHVPFIYRWLRMCRETKPSPSHCSLGAGWDAAGGWGAGGFGQHLTGKWLVAVCDGARDAVKFQETGRSLRASRSCATSDLTSCKAVSILPNKRDSISFMPLVNSSRIIILKAAIVAALISTLVYRVRYFRNKNLRHHLRRRYSGGGTGL